MISSTLCELIYLYKNNITKLFTGFSSSEIDLLIFFSDFFHETFSAQYRSCINAYETLL